MKFNHLEENNNSSHPVSKMSLLSSPGRPKQKRNDIGSHSSLLDNGKVVEKRTRNDTNPWPRPKPRKAINSMRRLEQRMRHKINKHDSHQSLKKKKEVRFEVVEE